MEQVRVILCHQYCFELYRLRSWLFSQAVVNIVCLLHRLHTLPSALCAQERAFKSAGSVPLAFTSGSVAPALASGYLQQYEGGLVGDGGGRRVKPRCLCSWSLPAGLLWWFSSTNGLHSGLFLGSSTWAPLAFSGGWVMTAPKAI